MKTILVVLLLVSSSVFAQSYSGKWQKRPWQQPYYQNDQIDQHNQNSQQPRLQQNFLNQQNQNQQNLQHQEPLDTEEQSSSGLPIFDLDY